MRSSSNEARRQDDHPRRRTAVNALLWFGVLVLAVFPFPWWW
jgi:hypothetical protein